jgi:hypothetical protein
MKAVILVGFVVALFIVLVWQWICGIDYMQENHPDYKGEDFFGEEDSSIIKPELWDKIKKDKPKIKTKIEIPEPLFKKFTKWLRNLFS